jgi:hypothetical protein
MNDARGMGPMAVALQLRASRQRRIPRLLTSAGPKQLPVRCKVTQQAWTVRPRGTLELAARRVRVRNRVVETRDLVRRRR